MKETATDSSITRRGTLMLRTMGFVLAVMMLTACSSDSDPAGASGGGEGVLRLVVSTSDLADITSQIAGDAVTVSSLIEPGKDPHSVDVRPEMARMVRDADALLIVGRGNEAHWLTELIEMADRHDLSPGQPNLIDASVALGDDDADEMGEGGEEGEDHHGDEDGSEEGGDSHPEGDPHYLLDPVNGLLVASHITDRLIGVAPDHTDVFMDNFEAFRTSLLRGLVGEWVEQSIDPDTLTQLLVNDELEAELEASSNLDKLGGWLGGIRPHRGTAFIGDHEVWDAFAERFGLVTAGYLEPAPGMEPTTQHLTQITNLIRSEGVPLILSCSHVPQRHATFLRDNTSAKLLLLADQVGEDEDAAEYISMFDHNIGKLIEALGN